MTGFKLYIIACLIGIGGLLYQAIKTGVYDIDFVMLMTVLIACIIGSSVQISHKNMEYHILFKEILAIYATGFLFAYLSFVLGDTIQNNTPPKEGILINPIHIAGVTSVALSYFSITFLKAIQKFFLVILSGISKGIVKVVVGMLNDFLKQK